jgi:DNA-binding transcriptional LysR family regulator
MELEPLRTYVKVVQTGSLSAAARAVARSQPAVTIQIQGLEREVGDQLLVRGARGVQPTAAGEILYTRAQSLLRQAEDLFEELRTVGSLQSGRLRLGATDVMALVYLPKVLQDFGRSYPGIQVTVEVEGSRELTRRVRKGDLDLALVTLPVAEADLEIRELHRERLCFVAAPGHRLGRRRLSLAQIAREPMIHHKRDSVTRAEVTALFRIHGLEPRIAMEVSSPEAIKALVSLGLGIAPLAPSQVAQARREGKLVRLSVPEFRCWRRSGLIRRSEGGAPRRVVAAFLASLPWVGGRPRPPRARAAK